MTPAWQPSGSKPRVLTIYSHGGAAHTSAAEAIRAALGQGYDIVDLAPLREVLGHLDPVRALTGGRVDCEQLYNRGAAGGYTWLLTQLGTAGKYLMGMSHKKLVSALMQHVQAAPPDAIISTMPFINGALLEVAENLGAPFIIVPPDLDVRTYLLGIRRPSYRRFCLTYAFTDRWLADYSESAELHGFQQMYAGFPLRPMFKSAVSREQSHRLRVQQGFALDRRIVVIMTGGAGGRSALRYCRALLAESNDPTHIVVCTGRNGALHAAVAALSPTPQTTVQALPFVDNIVNVLSCADILVTKPGPSSVMEGLRLGIPMLLDGTCGVVVWERAVVQFAQQYGAELCMHVGQAHSLMASLLSAPRPYASPVTFAHFAPRLRALVADMLALTDIPRPSFQGARHRPSPLSALNLGESAGSIPP